MLKNAGRLLTLHTCPASSALHACVLIIMFVILQGLLQWADKFRYTPTAHFLHAHKHTTYVHVLFNSVHVLHCYSSCLCEQLIKSSPLFLASLLVSICNFYTSHLSAAVSYMYITLRTVLVATPKGNIWRAAVWTCGATGGAVEWVETVL